METYLCYNLQKYRPIYVFKHMLEYTIFLNLNIVQRIYNIYFPPQTKKKKTPESSTQLIYAHPSIYAQTHKSSVSGRRDDIQFR